MKVKIKKVYYCDFCKKHSLRPLTEHEKHCTANPDRTCRMCGRTESLKSLIAKFKKQMNYTAKPNEHGGREFIKVRNVKLERILKEVENVDDEPCPMCALSIIRQTKVNQFPYEVNFDFKKALQAWWDYKNADFNESPY